MHDALPCKCCICQGSLNSFTTCQMRQFSHQFSHFLFTPHSKNQKADYSYSLYTSAYIYVCTYAIYLSSSLSSETLQLASHMKGCWKPCKFEVQEEQFPNRSTLKHLEFNVPLGRHKLNSQGVQSVLK